MSENNAVKNAVVTTESPASWNTRYQTPEGFICQITLRGENGKDLLEKANIALKWLLENGFLPCDFVPYRPKNNNQNPNTPLTSEANPPETPTNGNAHICPIHDVEMRKWEKNGKVWFSHKVDGGWCTGKSK